MEEQSFEDILSDVLHGRIPGIPKLEDLPSLWRNHPWEESDPDHPELPLRLALLAGYINLADTKPWAREGLRALLRELLAKGEDMPGLLVQWVLDQYARGDPAPRRGRPEESERDYHVVAGFTLLLEQKYTREAAIDKIAEVMSYEPDGIRYIIRKHEKTPSVR